MFINQEIWRNFEKKDIKEVKVFISLWFNIHKKNLV